MLSKKTFLRLLICTEYNKYCPLKFAVLISLNQNLVIKSVIALCHKLIGIIVENYNRDFTKMKFDQPENP